MSRFADGDYDNEYNINPFDGWRASAISGRKALANLEEFLAYLLAMPEKRILIGRFYDAATGAACTVGEYAKMRKLAPEILLDTEAAEEAEGGTEYFEQSPTVLAGKKVGLTSVLAYVLASANDRMDLDYDRQVELYGPPERSYELQYRHDAWPQATYDLVVEMYRAKCWKPIMAARVISDEERWEMVVAHVRALIAEGKSIAERRAAKRASKAVPA